jgi:crotonobetainyl-CoA:carnitine CoA-transferase CaiB-like acyl-CoA transferase
MPGPLAGIRIFDMTRILAGPTATQILADLGADVIKIERPGTGDDVRAWGPPYLKDKDGREQPRESVYFNAANRNKRSVTLNLASRGGQELALKLIARSDVLFENYKTGDLAKYGLAYAQIRSGFRGSSIARSPASARPAPMPSAPASISSCRPWAGS